MKFEKEFRSQMVPEWQGAYMDYSFLKSMLEDLKMFKLNNPPPRPHHHHSHPHHHHAGVSILYRTFSGLLIAPSSSSIMADSKDSSAASTSRTATAATMTSQQHHHRSHGSFRHEDPVILVQPIIHQPESHDLEHGGAQDVVHYEKYETKFQVPAEEVGKDELIFFQRLDEEFNKVNKFYKDKVDQVRSEAASLTRQMDALVAFRVKVEHPDQEQLEQLREEIAKSASVFPVSSPASTTNNTEKVHMDAIEESTESTSTRGSYSGENDGSHNGNYNCQDQSSTDICEEYRTLSMNGNSQQTDTDTHKKDANPEILETKLSAHLEILNNVKLNSTQGTPGATIKGILNKNTNNEGMTFRKQNLKRVEEQLKSAFVNFYHKLQLLKSYSFLNLLALSKTMNKYDKITSRHASKIYLNAVDNSYIGSSDDVTKLMDRVEASFIKHFSKSNRREGMSILRSKKKKERHATTFSSGFFGGCTMSLLICLILVIHIRQLVKKKGNAKYMETMFPLYSLFGFLVLHMLLYAADIYFWKLYRINYPFIFGFKQGTELGYREVFLLSTILATVSLACVLANLDLELDITSAKYKALTELLPLALVSVIFLITVCPFNIVYRSSRIFLLRTAFRCISAPLYKVTLSDFMLADQLSSQGQAIRSVAFYICYYGSGDYKMRETSCKTNGVYNSFYIMLAAFPFWLRALQVLKSSSAENYTQTLVESHVVLGSERFGR